MAIDGDVRCERCKRLEKRAGMHLAKVGRRRTGDTRIQWKELHFALMEWERRQEIQLHE